MIEATEEQLKLRRHAIKLATGDGSKKK